MPQTFQQISPLVWRGLIWGTFLLGLFLFALYAMWMPGRSYHEPLDPLSKDESAIRDELKVHVSTLAGTIGERNLQRYPALTRAAQYVGQTFRDEGYTVREQTFSVEGKAVQNLEVELPGRSRPEEIVLVDAHYDSFVGTPGADDNATGTAALLVLARLARQKSSARGVRFVAFVNEEPPYFQTSDMGSLVYAREAKQRRDKLVAMLSLETLGYYSDAPGSQTYPLSFRLFYPSTGNFVAFVGNLRSGHLVRKAVDIFSMRARFPCEGAAAPGFLSGVSWSDHWSFWQERYPAVMVTDTALFRNQQYHLPGDRPAALDYARLARVVEGLSKVIDELAGYGTVKTVP